VEKKILVLKKQTRKEGGGGGGSNSLIKSLNKIQEVQRGQEVPPDGGRVLPKNVQMTSFRPKGLINSNLSARLPGGPEGVDGFPSGHPDLNGDHLGLLKSVPKGVLIVKVLSASFRPKKIEDATTKDVERLPGVGEAAGVVPVTIEGSSSLSKTISPRRIKGQERATSSGAPHFYQTWRKASQARLT